MSYVALTARGQYLRLTEHEDRAVVRADSDSLDGCALFRRIPLGHDRIALRTPNGEYLTTRPDGMSYVLVPEPSVSAYSAFEEILWPDGRISLRSCHLTYVSARPDGTVVVNRTLTEDGERFDLQAVHVPDRVPAQVRRQEIDADALRSGG